MDSARWLIRASTIQSTDIRDWPHCYIYLGGRVLAATKVMQDMRAGPRNPGYTTTASTVSSTDSVGGASMEGSNEITVRGRVRA
jgi:hypothetical protein